MLKKIGLVLVALVAALLLFAATRPNSFSVERRIVIQAPPEKIQPAIEYCLAAPRAFEKG